MKSKPAPNFFVLLILSLMISSVVSCTFFTPTPLPTVTSTVTTTPTEKSIPTPTELPEQIDGVTVHYYYDRADFFPSEWLKDPLICFGEQFDLVEAPRVKSYIEDFISAYDSNFLRQNLTDIYLLDELTCFGNPFGGSNSISSVYLTVRTQDKGYTDQFLVSTLHHEFSSILMRNYRSLFPDQEWRLINPDSFVYSENDVQVVQEPTIRDQTKELLEAGFLTRYNTTTAENDFNTLVEWLSTRGTELCEIRSQYERIDRKAELAIQFYAAIGASVEFTTCI
jgi:hypothetical protein